MDASDETFVHVRRAARCLGVPVKWLKAEAKAGRVPALIVSRSVLVNLEGARRILLDRAVGVRDATGNGNSAHAAPQPESDRSSQHSQGT